MRRGFWLEEFPAAVTVCDRKGKVLEMNRRSAETFSKSGGKRLLGTDLRACHPEPARSKLQRLLDSGGTNVYTIAKSGKKKLIFQGPWYRNGRCGGLVELSIVLPSRVPHFVRSHLPPPRGGK